MSHTLSTMTHTSACLGIKFVIPPPPPHEHPRGPPAFLRAQKKGGGESLTLFAADIRENYPFLCGTSTVCYTLPRVHHYKTSPRS